MTIRDVAGDLKSYCKSRKHRSNDKEAGKIDFVEVLWIQKKVRDAQVLTKIARDHGD